MQDLSYPIQVRLARILFEPPRAEARPRQGAAMTRALLLALVSTAASAEGLYLGVGAGAADGMQQVSPYQAPSAGGAQPTGGPFGLLEVGYGFSSPLGETSISAFHLSSMATGRDKGINFVGVTHRFHMKVRP